MPLVSVGMPVYNGEKFIKDAINSILNQSFKEFELIISDNASIDKTEEICRFYSTKDNRIRYFRNEKNLGATYNFNRVFKLSSGKYFMWAAHDDMYAPDFISKCVKVLEQNPSIVLCFSKTKFIDEQGKFLKNYIYWPDVTSPEPSRRFYDLVVGNYIVVEIFGLIRSNILKMTRLFGDFSPADKILLGELALYGPFFEISEYLFLHREHPHRSAKLHRDHYSYTTWWAPSRANEIIFPTWRLFFEQLSAINKGPLNRKDKIKCYLQMTKWIKNKRIQLINDVIIAYKTRRKVNLVEL
jgi:glycosyltransferase involved in cell wall biosynthesis